MFKHILVPVDLAHLGTLDRALLVAAQEARQHGARITYVSVSGTGPGAVAHNPEEFRTKLDEFARQQGEIHKIDAEALALFSNDVTTDVDDALLDAVKESDADLVIMASHKPGIAEYFWPSNGGKLASHAGTSVFLVRDT